MAKLIGDPQLIVWLRILHKPYNKRIRCLHCSLGKLFSKMNFQFAAAACLPTDSSSEIKHWEKGQSWVRITIFIMEGVPWHVPIGHLY